MNEFTNPYKGTPKEHIRRTTIDVDMRELSILSANDSKVGVMQTTINILLHKLVNQLKSHGLTEYNPDKFRFAVANATITLGGCEHMPAKVFTRDDATLVEAICNNVQRSAIVVATTGSLAASPTETTRGNDGCGASNMALPPSRQQESHDVPSTSERGEQSGSNAKRSAKSIKKSSKKA